jgi:hypothetical protein
MKFPETGKPETIERRCRLHFNNKNAGISASYPGKP